MQKHCGIRKILAAVKHSIARPAALTFLTSVLASTAPLAALMIIVPTLALASTAASPRVAVSFLPVDALAAPKTADAAAPQALCTPAYSTYSTFNFDAGGPLTVQAGLAETEIAAASYVLTAADFPVRLDQAQCAWGTNGATIPTTTEWSLIVWQGIPSTGTPVITVSSDGISIPHLDLPSGTNATVIQVDFLPNPPDHIVIQDNGSHTFSIGFRIDNHHQQSGNPCSVAPPSCCNAFPTTDTSGLGNSANNWLFGINCGAFGCPANGGWARFSALPGFCRPTGDWNIRALYWPSYALGELATLTCADGLDNDCDGFTDCDDSDCIADPMCAAVGAVAQLPGPPVQLGIVVPAAPGFPRTALMRVPRDAEVHLQLFDLRGRTLGESGGRIYAAGTHEIALDFVRAADAFPAGTYFLRAKAQGLDAATTKFVVVR